LVITKRPPRAPSFETFAMIVSPTCGVSDSGTSRRSMMPSALPATSSMMASSITIVTLQMTSSPLENGGFSRSECVFWGAGFLPRLRRAFGSPSAFAASPSAAPSTTAPSTASPSASSPSSPSPSAAPSTAPSAACTVPSADFFFRRRRRRFFAGASAAAAAPSVGVAPSTGAAASTDAVASAV
jgi:hypothetical protein